MSYDSYSAIERGGDVVKPAPVSDRRLALATLGTGSLGSWPVVVTPPIPARRVKRLSDAHVKTLRDLDRHDAVKNRGWGNASGNRREHDELG